MQVPVWSWEMLRREPWTGDVPNVVISKICISIFGFDLELYRHNVLICNFTWDLEVGPLDLRELYNQQVLVKLMACFLTMIPRITHTRTHLP